MLCESGAGLWELGIHPSGRRQQLVRSGNVVVAGCEVQLARHPVRLEFQPSLPSHLGSNGDERCRYPCCNVWDSITEWVDVLPHQ